MAPNAGNEAILNKHFCRDVIKEPKPKPIKKLPTAHQMEERLDDLLPDSPKPKKKCRELIGIEMSHGDAWKQSAKGTHRPSDRKDT
jgi:hypothetical protein